MDPDQLTALRAQIAAATAATLAVTVTAAQDKIEAEEVRDLIVADLSTANRLIDQLTTTRTKNTVLTAPKFCLPTGKISPDQILNYSSKTDISIY